MPKLLRKPSSEVLAEVHKAYDSGCAVDALRAAEKFCPIVEWEGVDACCLASRIAANTGAQRLSTILVLRAWHADKTHPEAQLGYGFELSSRRGALTCWLAMREWPQPNQPSPDQQADLLGLQGVSAAYLRDFAAAEDLLGRAEILTPSRPWIRLQRAHLLREQDRVEEALEVAQSACKLHPQAHYRPGVQVCAHLLQLLDKDEQAIELLQAADASLQSSNVAAQLYSILSENGRWLEARAALDRFSELSPLIEVPLQKWVAAQRARVAHRLGERHQAAQIASQLDDPFQKRFAERLLSPPEEPERVQHNITFVRQHFKTCAPASLAAIGRFWSMPADHLKLVEAMCYDGTLHWVQREWAEKNGWYVRQFRVTWESAVALLLRGMPFAISTVEATSAHMRVVAGFDRTRGSLLFRDPGLPYILEADAEQFLACYRPFGPMGMLFVPVSERSRVEGIELPDADAWDHYYPICKTVAAHDRTAAVEALNAMEKLFPEHELVWEARLELAAYDANAFEQVRCLDRLLELFPNNATRLLRRLAVNREVSREERIRDLKKACATPTPDPSLFIEMARALQGDARFLGEARFWLKRAFAARPMDSNAIMVRADLAWNDGRFEEATDLYWFAATLEEFREGYYQKWFLACRRTRRTESALSHLRERFTRFGNRSDQPALTLAWALRELEQDKQAKEVLAEAVRLRPADGTLLLRSAALLASLRDQVQADRLLAQAQGKVRRADWLRTSAEIAELRLQPAETLWFCREILKIEPLAMDAHAAITRALGRLEGTDRALNHLRNASTQFPHHCELLRMIVEWSRPAGPSAVASAARELLQIEPSNAWAKRELALALSDQALHDEAIREAEAAVEIEPQNTFCHSVLGHVRREQQQVARAREDLRRAVELSVDNTYALQGLVQIARTDAERNAELDFIERELVRQVVQGDGLLTYLSLARPIVDPAALLGKLRAAHAERPDLWHAWSALISQAVHLGELSLALDLAQQAVQRFPHLPRVWLDLAAVHRWRNETDQEITAATNAFEMNPGWSLAALDLAGALERSGMMDKARQVYERALLHSGRDAELQASYAHLLWRQKDEKAIPAIEQALCLAPGYERAWGLFIDWSSSSRQSHRASEFARTLTLERPGDPIVWLMLARALTGTQTIQERLEAVDKALQLNRRLTDAWDLKAEVLAEAGRFDEAVCSCEEGSSFCDGSAFLLHGRRAWVEAARGQIPAAIALMRTVLAENAGFAWGWNQLAVWLLEQQSTGEAEVALQQLLRLRPRDAFAHRQLGFLRLQAGDNEGAQKAFSKAIEIAPTDSAAAQNLVILQLNARQLTDASATLRLMETHQPGACTLALRILFRLESAHHDAADKLFAELGEFVDPDPWPVEAVADGYKRVHRSRRAIKILKHALKQSSCNPQAAAALIRLLLAQKRDGAAVWCFLGIKPGELQRRAASSLVRGLAELRSRFALRVVLWLRRDALFNDDSAWAQAGSALTTFNRMRDAAEWLSDWQRRRDVEPWVLFNLCLALRHLGRYEEANSLAHHVISTLGHKEHSSDMRLFLAIEAALSGEIAAAREHLAHVVVRENVAYDVQLTALIRALAEFQEVPDGDRPKAFSQLRKRFGDNFSAASVLGAGSDVRHVMRRSAQCFIEGGAGWRARTWFAWKLNWQYLLLPLLPVAFMAALSPPVMLGVLIYILRRNRN